MTAVTLTNPVVIAGYLLALAVGVFAIIKKCGFKVTAVSVALFVLTAAYALIAGATLYETATVAVIFFIINLAAKTFGGK